MWQNPGPHPRLNKNTGKINSDICIKQHSRILGAAEAQAKLFECSEQSFQLPQQAALLVY